MLPGMSLRAVLSPLLLVHGLVVDVGDDGLHVSMVRFDGKPSVAVEEETAD